MWRAQVQDQATDNNVSRTVFSRSKEAGFIDAFNRQVLALPAKAARRFPTDPFLPRPAGTGNSITQP